MIFLLLVYIKKFRKTFLFVYKWELQWLPSVKHNVHLIIYRISKKLRFFFIYKNQDTLQKARQFSLCFYIYKSGNFKLRDFSWEFWSWRGTFLYAKKQCTLRYIFIWKKMYFALWFYIQKACHFALHVYLKKNVLCVKFLYLKLIV